MPLEFTANINAWHATMDAFHTLAFTVISVTLYGLLKQHKYVLPLTLLISISLILAIELIQPSVGRSASFTDIIYGVVGSFIGLIWIRFHSRSRLTLPALAITTLLVSSNTLTEWLAAYWQAKHVDDIGTFESTLQLRHWRAYGEHNQHQANITRTHTPTIEDNNALQVNTIAGAWSGVIYYANHHDWSHYQAFSLSIYNPTTPFKLGMRLDDSGPSEEYEQRFNSPLNINTGWNTFTFKLSEIKDKVADDDFNLHEIESLRIFSYPDSPAHSFYLDNIILTQ